MFLAPCVARQPLPLLAPDPRDGPDTAKSPWDFHTAFSTLEWACDRG